MPKYRIALGMMNATVDASNEDDAKRIAHDALGHAHWGVSVPDIGPLTDVRIYPWDVLKDGRDTFSVEDVDIEYPDDTPGRA